jgi:hypothetical protein
MGVSKPILLLFAVSFITATVEGYSCCFWTAMVLMKVYLACRVCLSR